MTTQQIEAMKQAIEALKKGHYYMIDAGLPNQSLLNEAFTAYKALEKALEEHAMREVQRLGQEIEQEPVKITHKHEWFRTGEMKVGQMRCISCGTWGQEEMPQRTWVWLTKVERIELLESTHPNNRWSLLALCEALLKEKNT